MTPVIVVAPVTKEPRPKTVSVSMEFRKELPAWLEVIMPTTKHVGWLKKSAGR